MFPEMTTSRYYWFCLCATVFILHFADCNGSRVICPMLKCKACESGYKTARGCRTCECLDPCENAGIICNETQRCKETQVQCFVAPCDPVLECAPLCSQVRCSRFCASGYALDSNGCQTCRCINPCENAGIFCNATQRCKETQVQCFVAPCDPILKCVPRVICPMLKCKACESGYKTARGCRTCECMDPCENAGIICDETQRCKETQVQCFVAPCDPVLECAPLCPQVRCSRFCASGYAFDSNGCQTCRCIDPCENAGIICNATQRCKETHVQCFVAPCDPILKCAPRKFIKCGPVCQIYCEYGNVLNEYGCPTCYCKDPCKDLGCVAPKVCVPHEVVCIRAPCYPIPTCCTPLLTCKLACPNGYALDRHGCQICQCK